MGSSYKAFWFTDDGNLRNLGRTHLKELFNRYSKEMTAAKLVIEEPKEDDDYYKALARVFMRPEGIPTELHEALYYINALNNEKGLGRISTAIIDKKLDIDLHAESSTADKVLQAWLQDSDLVKGFQMDVSLDASKSFTHFVAVKSPVPPPRLMTPDIQKAFQQDLGIVFNAHARGSFCEITEHRRNHEWVYVVRHGDPYKRDTEYKKPETEDAAKPKPLYFWPCVQDLIVYNERSHVMRTNAQCAWHKKAYAQYFGKHIFGDETLFEERVVFTLEPLRTVGREILNGTPYGIDAIQLTELQTVVDPEIDDLRIRRSKDVFTSYENEGGFPENEEIKQAGFRVRFANAKSWRNVTVCGSRARYTQDANGKHVTAWLEGTGIVIGGKLDPDAIENDSYTQDE